MSYEKLPLDWFKNETPRFHAQIHSLGEAKDPENANARHESNFPYFLFLLKTLDFIKTEKIRVI